MTKPDSVSFDAEQSKLEAKQAIDECDEFLLVYINKDKKQIRSKIGITCEPAIDLLETTATRTFKDVRRLKLWPNQNLNS